VLLLIDATEDKKKQKDIPVISCCLGWQQQ